MSEGDLHLLYFIIIPVFACALVCMTCAALASRFIERLRPVYPFAWRVLLGSTLGFVVANGVMLALVLLAVQHDGTADAEQAGDAAKLSFAAALFFGPVIASLLGFIGGSILGVWFAISSRSRRPQDS